MPIAYRYLPEHSLIVVKVWGVVVLQDFLDHLAALVADPRIPQEHLTLFDAKGVTELNLSPPDIEAIAEYTQAHPSKIIAKKLAIITKGDTDTKLAERYQQLAASFKESTIVFYNQEVACKWLGVPGDI